MRLTYAAIGARLGITSDAARQLVRRRGWQRIISNRQGAPTIILVNEDELAAEQWRQDRLDPPTPDDRVLTADDAGPLTEIARLIDLLTAADARIERAEQRADQAVDRALTADNRADRAEQGRHEAETRASQADQDRREAVQRADELRLALERATSEAGRAMQRVEELERAG